MRAETSHTSRKRRKFWDQHLAQWQLSGLSQVEYCRLHDLSVTSFGYHKRVHGNSVPALVEVTPSLLAFSPSKPIELRVGGRYAILIEPDFNAETLRRLIKVLDA